MQAAAFVLLLAVSAGANETRFPDTLVTRSAQGFSEIRFSDHSRDGRTHFLREMPSTIRANHPAIVPVANAIRAISKKPLEQICLVNDVTHLLVDYDEDVRVYGAEEYHATLDEMLARRREAGWLYLRDDCDGRAVFAAHLLATLGIQWHLEASYWKGHAWIVATVDGVDYDLLDLRNNSPETDRLSYRLIGRWMTRPSHPPPYFDWRAAWAQRTHRDFGIGLRLGMLQLTSTPDHPRERYSTDWTKVAPTDRSSPWDRRLADATSAGFPLGAPLGQSTVEQQSR